MIENEQTLYFIFIFKLFKNTSCFKIKNVGHEQKLFLN